MVNVGDVVKFGKYYQSSSEQKDEIEWIVLAQKKDSVLLLSKYILDAKPYNEELVDVTWETCSLRKWLNDDFLKEAFSKKEIENILDSEITTPNNRFSLRANAKNIKSSNDKFVSGGNDTVDKVFLLSWREVVKYFPEHPDSEDKIRYAQVAAILYHPKDIKTIAKVLSGIGAKGTAYAKEHKLDQLEDCSTIWFRSPGNTQQMAVTNLLDDILYRPGCEVDDATNGVRPALWVNKEAFLSSEELKTLEEQKMKAFLSSPTFLKLKEGFELIHANKHGDAKRIFQRILWTDENNFLANFGMACVENYYQINDKNIMNYLDKAMNNFKKANIVEKEMFKENINSISRDNELDNAGIPLLVNAVCCNNYEIVKFLLENGANPNLKTNQGRKAGALFFAALGAYDGHDRALEIGEILIDYGADIFAKTSDGYTIFGNRQHEYGNGCKLNPSFEKMVRRKYKEVITKKRIEHPVEKKILENNKSILLEEINRIKTEIKSKEKEVNNLAKKLAEIKGDKAKLSLFKIKERRKINSKIKEIENEIGTLSFKNYTDKKDCLSKIKSKESKIAEIDATLNGELKLSY